ncbi:hypothetical protein H072_11583 [Dactylellina haptotyla CBS 200.50]|uniref:Apple domain-containing protein n=1 Tax=Dactylellina haptotyla (strain CBS 200.50) TaxID=1284197 RepID=S8BIT4_DACHA|nr:hypothetical protein H072_11583 [Dactylellina haptotyla CBS 200.50]
MKLFSPLSLLTGALATVVVKRGAGYSWQARYIPNPGMSLQKRVHTEGCNRDNCLRAMYARSTAASTFCATFTTAALAPRGPTVTTTTSGQQNNLGPWQSQCENDPKRQVFEGTGR